MSLLLIRPDSITLKNIVRVSSYLLRLCAALCVSLCINRVTVSPPPSVSRGETDFFLAQVVRGKYLDTRRCQTTPQKRCKMLPERPNYQITKNDRIAKSLVYPWTSTASKYALGGVSYGIIRLLHRRMGGSVGGGGSVTGRERERGINLREGK